MFIFLLEFCQTDPLYLVNPVTRCNFEVLGRDKCDLDGLMHNRRPDADKSSNLNVNIQTETLFQRRTSGNENA